MTYGTIKVDTVTFTNAGVDKSVTLSGLVQNPVFSGNVTVTGTLSGVTVTGTTANFTSGNFTNISGGTHTITSGVFAAGSAASPSITFTGDLNTGIYSPGADQVAISTGGSGRLFVDANGCVGLGATPDNQAYRLQIYNASQDAAYLSIGNSVSGSGALNGLVVGQNQGDSLFINRENGSQQFYTNGSERLRITAAGLVGVGTSSPTNYGAGITSLSVNGSAGGVADFYFNGARQGWIGTMGSNQMVIDTAGAAIPLTLKTNNNTALTIDTSQRVGVGTTSPGSTLDVRGTITATNASNSVELLGAVGAVEITRTDGDPFIDFKTSTAEDFDVRIQQISNGLTFWTGGNGASSERLRIDSSGRVGIGTSSPSTLLHIQSTDPAFRFKRSDAGTDAYGELTTDTSGLVTMKCDPANAAAGSGFRITVDNSEALRVDSSGRVGIGTTAPSYNVHNFVNTASATASVVTESTQGPALLGIFSGNSSVGEIRFGDFNALRGKIQSETDDSLSFYTGGTSTERFRCDSSGRLLVGTSSARTNVNGYQPLFQVETAASDDALTRYVSFTYGRNSGAGGFGLALNRHASTTVGGQAVVADNYVLGQLDFNGSDGTNFITGARIQTQVDGTPGANDMPGRLVFSTTADGASSPTERMRITSTGQLRLAGAGITFNGDTAAANELDDYEEGTHTATLTPSSSGTITLNSSYQTLAYTKIGRLVSVRGTLIASSSSSPVGYVSVSLPFAAANVSGIGYAGGSVFVDNSTGVNVNQYVVSVNGANARIYLGDATGLQSDSAQAIGSGGQIYLEINYHI